MERRQHETSFRFNETPAAAVADLEAFAITSRLRWRNGVLEQLHLGTRGTLKWERVPDVTEGGS